jgi:hypothetical protein
VRAVPIHKGCGIIRHELRNQRAARCGIPEPSRKTRKAGSGAERRFRTHDECKL